MKAILLPFLIPLIASAGNITIETTITPVTAVASSEFGEPQAAVHLIDGSGLNHDAHDKHPGSHTMWHTSEKPTATAPAAGLPAAPAWVRFEFQQPHTLGEIRIWNHNQANLTNRGFRHTRIHGSTDGTTWKPLAPNTELTQGGDTAQTIAVKSPAPVKAVIIAADDNWGDSHYGLSEVRFVDRREVATKDLPVPETISLTDFPFEWDAKGNPHRQATVSLGGTALYEAADVTVECGGATATRHIPQNNSGTRTITIPLPPGKADTRMASAKVNTTIKTARWTRSASSDIQAPKDYPNLREVIVVFKTHFDIGYTHRVREIVQHYRTGMIDKAMDIMDQSKNLPPEQQFAWTGPGWVMSKVLDDWDGQTPARRKRLDDYVKAGKFSFHAMPFTLESDACEPEEMARGFSFTSDLCRKYGMPLPRSAKVTDVPSHGGALSTVLANAGVKFIHIGCNWPSGYVKTPGLFWWEGPDGSRTLTFYSSNYGTAIGFGWPEKWGGNDFYIGHRFTPPANWPYQVWPAIIVTMDNSGPPTAESVRSAFEAATKALPGVKVRMGTMDDFVESILGEKPDIPVVKGEMPDTWIHGIMSDPGGIKLSRNVHPQLAAAEALHTQLNQWGAPQPDISREVSLAYEKILLYGEHTWGCAPSVNHYGEAFKKLDPKTYANLEASWEDKTDYIREADKISNTITKANLQTLAKRVKAPAGSSIIYNPLPWKRSGSVEVQGKTRFVKDVPPCGYLTLTENSAASGDTVLESPFYRLVLDPATGSISSLIDKRTGREWVDPEAAQHLGQYLNERFTFEQTHRYTMAYQQGRAEKWPHPGMHKPGMISEKQVPYRAALSAKGTVRTENGSAVIDCPADPANHLPATSLRITLSQDQPCIDLEITIKDKAKDNWPEADWLCLPFKIANPQFRVHRQLGVMNPATDILPGANRDLISVGNGVTIADADGSGIAVCPLDHPLVSLGRPGCWKSSKDAGEFTPGKPVVYLNLYNNQWNTNFRYWYPGTWSSRLRLWTFDSNTSPDAVMATPALETRNPLVAVTATPAANASLPASQSGLTVSRKGVTVTAFCNNSDGGGTLLRVWEQAGNSGDLTISIPGKFTTATPVDLRGGKTGEPIAIAAGRLVIQLPAYAPASFVLR